MSRSFEIEKEKFGITRYVFSSFVEFNVFFHCYLTLPLSTIYLVAWIGNGGEPLPRIITSLPGFALVMWLWLSFCLPIVNFFIAIREKMRLPISVELTSASLVLIDKKGKRWSIRYANCRYASDFVRCSFNCFFKGTLQRGIKIYVPREHLTGFPRGFYDGNENQSNMAFHVPMNLEDRQETASFLESKNCGQVPPMALAKIATFLFAPTLVFCPHIALISWLKQVGMIEFYGFFFCIIIGVVSGVFLSASVLIKPYRRVEYLRFKRHMRLGNYGMIAFLIGYPFYLWGTQADFSPSFFEAALVVLLWYISSYLWVWCLLKQESETHKKRHSKKRK